MNQALITAIAEGDFSAILNITSQLTDSERYETIAAIRVLDPYSEKDFPQKNVDKKDTYRYKDKIFQALNYALITMVREENDIAKAMIDKENYYGETYQVTPYAILASYYFEPVINYFTQFPPDKYIKKILKERYNKEINGLSFGFQWYFYKKGWIPFDEERFVKNLLEVSMFNRYVTADVNFLLQNPEAIEKVLLQLYRIEAKVLDLSKWESDDTLRKTNYLGSAKVTTYWDDVFELLVHYGYQIPRSFVGQLLESLLNQWKKPHLDWHCRLLKWLAPTQEELLAHQQTLFAVLGTGVGSVVKTVMEYIVSIANAPQFDFERFMQQFPLAFTVEKQPKALFQGVEILAKEFKKHPPTDVSYREQLAVLFTQPDVKLQEAVAELLTTYFNQEGLPEVIAPYRDYLKGKAQDLLATLSPSESSAPSDLSDRSASSENSKTACAARTLTPIIYPLTPNETLFLIGDCIREKTAATIDVFFDALVRLQDQIPADYAEQVKPYLKQLLAREWFVGMMPLLYHFLDSWSNQSPTPLVYDPDKEWKEIQKLYKEHKYTQADKLDKPRVMHIAANQAKETFPYLFNKIARTLQKLKEKDTLPFLSTPTHEPFYIEAEVLVDKLLQYEAQGKAPDFDDLIVACNRLLFWEVSAAAKEKAQQLKGDYAPAIQYYLGITDKIQLNEALLPLWTQITRLKHPDEEFKVFENTQAKNILSVVKPFYIRYGWEKRTYANGEVGEEFTYHCNHYYKYGKNKSRPTLYNYYNANEGKCISAQEAEYKLSLNPHYPDAILCAYIALWATMNEADQVRDMTLPLEAVLRYDLRVRHSGWLYIGACLLFEKRPSRDLAYEYICQAIARGEDLTHLKTYFANVLAWDYLPIPRFIEFLDRPNPPAVKAFGKEVVELYLEEVKKRDKLPRNHKKLAAFND
ncbi:DUF6493 family protein [Capnocytophaga sputigena]|uniref:DUF4034 domain-containing protein n=1 Tax=Capnocytophaga sputigena TaxID=1019 RepID=A0AAX2I8X6_CAPSP|nr:DUF6493 family protein [Capnocytophaga sputigena]ATA85191.1 hypothetical protein CGC55_12105 [Capnocytophaga sputigena]EEB65214.1 hypothetical protein CAPSP0001_2683 [Capnocytophaga sputigena ATCC 33612]SQA74713.1 Uncharacterised protein [Capnocytophaga sputigena]